MTERLRDIAAKRCLFGRDDGCGPDCGVCIRCLAREATAALATLTADRDQQARRADEAERELQERKAAAERVHATFKERDANGKCACCYCRGDIEQMYELACNYELDRWTFEEERDKAEAERDTLRAQLAAIVEKINAAIEECRKDGLREPAHEQGLDEALDIIRATRTQEPTP